MAFFEEVEELKALINHDLEILAGTTVFDGIGQLCDDLCLHLRTLAGCAILVDADHGAFHRLSARCGLVRAHYLSGCQAAAVRTPFNATGNNSAIFDVLAARDYDLARRLAVLSAAEHWEGEEYLDDFCLIHFIHQVVSPEKYGANDLADTLVKFEAALSGDSSAYLHVYRALLKREQGAFDDAFAELIREREAELRRESAKFYTEEIILHVQSRIFSPGLGLLNLAETVGIRAEGEYRYCPPIARLRSEWRASQAELFQPV